MSYAVLYRPRALADIDTAAEWFEQQAGLAADFILEVDRSLAAVAENPRQYPRFRRRPEIRRALTRRFPYRIFFQCESDHVIILRVLHAARSDDEWRSAK